MRKGRQRQEVDGELMGNKNKRNVPRNKFTSFVTCCDVFGTMSVLWWDDTKNMMGEKTLVKKLIVPRNSEKTH